jgi:hypothetical protein
MDDILRKRRINKCKFNREVSERMSLHAKNLVESTQKEEIRNEIDTSKIYKLVPGNNCRRALTFEELNHWDQVLLLNYASDPLGGTPVKLHKAGENKYRMQMQTSSRREKMTWIRGLKNGLILDEESTSTVWHFDHKGNNIYVISGYLGYLDWYHQEDSNKKWVYMSKDPLKWHLIPTN